MKTAWLHKTSCSELIVFFSGVGSRPAFFEFLPSKKYDVLMVYDYSDLNFEEVTAFEKGYKKSYLVSWSFGVKVATLWASMCEKKEFLHRAINGTLDLISNDTGIPSSRFQKSVSACEKGASDFFFLSVFGDKKIFSDYFQKKALPTAQELSKELSFFEKFNSFFLSCKNISSVFLSGKDLVIPYKNMLAFCKEKNLTTFSFPNEAHFLFSFFNTWDSILDYD